MTVHVIYRGVLPGKTGKDTGKPGRERRAT